jgi:hypothetical protein
MTAPERFADSQIPLAPRAPSIHEPICWWRKQPDLLSDGEPQPHSAPGYIDRQKTMFVGIAPSHSSQAFIRPVCARTNES